MLVERLKFLGVAGVDLAAGEGHFGCQSLPVTINLVVGTVFWKNAVTVYAELSYVLGLSAP